jgi:hypothetical protein
LPSERLTRLQRERVGHFLDEEPYWLGVDGHSSSSLMSIAFEMIPDSDTGPRT